MAEKLMAIIILNWNRLPYSKITIENIIEKTKVPHVLVLVDNNSLPETGVRDYLSSITKSNTNAEEVIHVFNSKNLGVSGGRNSGIYEVIEKQKLPIEYIFNLDDDVLVKDRFDMELCEVCDKIGRIGITGINVEPQKFPVVSINGIKVQLKSQGNLGGAALCIPRRVFNMVGYYGVGRGTLYGIEDSFMKIKLDMLGLLSAYVLTGGTHFDKDQDKSYRKAKNRAHQKGSEQLKEFCKSVAEMRKTGNIYTPFILPESYHPVDEDIFTNDLIIQDRKL